MSLRSDLDKAADGLSLSTNELLKFAAKGLSAFADSSLNTDLLNALNDGRTTISDNQLALYVAKAATSLEPTLQNVATLVTLPAGVTNTNADNVLNIFQVGRLAVIQIDAVYTVTGTPASIDIILPDQYQFLGSDFAAAIAYQVTSGALTLGSAFLQGGAFKLFPTDFSTWATANIYFAGQLVYLIN